MKFSIFLYISIALLYVTASTNDYRDQTDVDRLVLSDLNAIVRDAERRIAKSSWLDRANSLTLLKCCGLSPSPLCTQLCVNAGKKSDIQDWHRFNDVCVGMFGVKVNSSVDRILYECVTEALLPCQKGCACESVPFCKSSLQASGLQHFRQCYKRTDQTAEQQFNRLIIDGQLHIHMGTSVVQVYDRLDCVNVVKAYICLHFMEPCDLQRQQSCLRHCHSFLNRCIIWPNEQRPNLHQMNLFCTDWGVNSSDRECFNQRFIPPTPTQELYGDSCLYNPCLSNRTHPVCVAQPDPQSDNICGPYHCAKGCQISRYPIRTSAPVNTTVLLSIPKANQVALLGDIDTQIEESMCRCAAEGRWVDCTYLRLRMAKRGDIQPQSFWQKGDESDIFSTASVESSYSQLPVLMLLLVTLWFRLY